jgi:hypothetical protein
VERTPLLAGSGTPLAIALFTRIYGHADMRVLASAAAFPATGDDVTHSATHVVDGRHEAVVSYKLKKKKKMSIRSMMNK